MNANEIRPYIQSFGLKLQHSADEIIKTRQVLSMAVNANYLAEGERARLRRIIESLRGIEAEILGFRKQIKAVTGAIGKKYAPPNNDTIFIP